MTEYQAAVLRTMNTERPHEYALTNWALGLAGEGGEVVDEIKKHVFHGHQLDRDKIKRELGDMLWYLTALASDLDISLEDIAEMNVDKLRERYPAGFSEERSRNRKEGNT